MHRVFQISSGRVLGILAVTRSFGDHGMKDFVTAQPHLVETELESHGDTPFIILACDGNEFIVIRSHRVAACYILYLIRRVGCADRSRSV